MKIGKLNPKIEKTCHLSFLELDDLCDDPKRNETKQEVHAVLTLTESGFALTARDGDQLYKIVDERGRQVKFRTWEQVMDRLTDVPHIHPEIICRLPRIDF